MAEPALPPRPEGEVLWLHATNIERYLALCDIGHRLKAMRPDLVVIATWEAEMGDIPLADGCDFALGTLPEDQTIEAKSFLSHWRPDLCLWAGGNLRRGVLRQMRDQRVSALLIDIRDDELPTRKLRWLPDQRHRMFSTFETVLTPSVAVRNQLLRGDLAEDRLLLAPPLRISTLPPGCLQEDLNALQQSLASRPVWLAAHAQLKEIPTLLDAHRIALRLLHRLLLVVAIDSPDCHARARSLLRASGLQCADWTAGEEPDDYTQVLLVDCEELGLWYRVAPVSFLANSMMPQMPGQSPLDALALGSVVLHGPGTGQHRDIYARLGAIGASERIKSPQELAEMVIHLSAPDMAAEMALTGWNAVTEGAAMTDQLIDRVQDILDLREEQNAAP